MRQSGDCRTGTCAIQAEALHRAARKTIPMSQTKPSVERRPLSPHLGIYRMQINMVMSIVHRITGAALYFGTVLLAAWLISAALGANAFAFVNGLFAHPLGKFVLFGYSWALLHHMLGGVRHLIWDTGRAMSPKASDTLGWLTIIGSVALTALLWIVALSQRGGI
jgi:succinate dehydrogenase / fumarate reductase cytochrome b subunit